MTPWRDPDDVDGHQIDATTAEGLLSGRLTPDDAPPELAALAALMQAAHGPVAPSELVGHDAAVAAMVSAAGEEIDLRPGSRSGSALRRAASAPLLVVMVVGFGAAVAAAATGALREPKPDVVVLDDVATTVESTTVAPTAVAPSAAPSTGEAAPQPTSEAGQGTSPTTPGGDAGDAPTTEPPLITEAPERPSVPTVPAATPASRPPQPSAATPTTSLLPGSTPDPSAGPPAVTRGMCVAFGNRADPPGRSVAAAALAQAASEAGVTVEELCAPLLQGGSSNPKGSSNEPPGRR